MNNRKRIKLVSFALLAFFGGVCLVFGEMPEERRKIDVVLQRLDNGDRALEKGDFGEAFRSYQRALNYAESVLGAEHPVTGVVCGVLAKLHQERGEFDKGIECAEKAYKIAEKNYGPDSPATVGEKNNLATAYIIAGRRGVALEMLEEVLKQKIKLHGENAQEVVTAYNNLGLLYRDLGRYAEAEKFLRKVLELDKSEKSRGGNLANLGGLYFTQKRFREAKEYYVQAEAIDAKVFGLESPNRATSLMDLAGACYRLGENDQALRHYERAFSIIEKTGAADFPVGLLCRENLAVLIGMTGNLSEGEKRLRGILQRKRRMYGDRHAKTVMTLFQLAANLMEQGKAKESLEFVDQAIERFEKTTLPPDWGTEMYFLRAMIYLQTGLKGDVEALEKTLNQLKKGMELALRIRREASGWNNDWPRRKTGGSIFGMKSRRSTPPIGWSSPKTESPFPQRKSSRCLKTRKRSRCNT